MILITGATGHVGGRTAELLSADGRELRLLARDPARAPRLPGARAVAGDYEDAAAIEAAVAGVRTVFLVSAGEREPGVRPRLHGNVIDAGAGAGVERLVYLSFQGASPRSRFPASHDHAATEDHLRASGLGFTILRDSLYMDLLASMFGDDGVVRGPAGDGRAAWVAREDVARVAATVLADADGGHAGAIYDLTGPEALGLAEVARRLSGLAGRELRYHDETVEDGRRWRAALDAPAWEVELWLGSYLAIAAGELARVSDAVARITGRAALGLEAYYRERPHLLARLRPRA